MKNILCVVVTLLVLFMGFSYARDLNVMVDDALSKVANSASKIENTKVITIFPFEYSSEVTIKNVEDKIALKLAKTGKFKVLDRKSLEAIIQEQKLSLTGITEETAISKVGKLLNSDSLLFGKVSISDERIIINVSLKDIATGAIVWADEFVGEDLNRIYFGPGIRSGFFNASMPITISDGNGNLEIVRPNDITNGFFFAFMFSYIQRMQEVKAISLSLDGIFYRGYIQPDLLDTKKKIGADEYRLTMNGNFTDLKMNLCALVRIHPGYIFDWGSDFLIFYAGPGLDANYILASSTYRLNQVTGGTFDTGELNYSKGFGQALAFGGVTFRAGIEMKFTNNFSIFMEAYYIPEFTYKFQDIHTQIQQNLTVSSGSFYGFGARYLLF